MAAVLVVINIISAHDGPHLALLHGSLKGGQIDLVQGTVGYFYVYVEAVFFVVVQAIMLHTGRHTQRLHALNVGHHHGRGEEGVFAHILEVAAVKGCAVYVYARAQYHILATIQCLFAQTMAVKVREGGVPRGSQAGKGRKGYARVVGLACLFPLVPQYVGAHTVRAIIGPKVGEPQSWHSSR